MKNAVLTSGLTQNERSHFIQQLEQMSDQLLQNTPAMKQQAQMPYIQSPPAPTQARLEYIQPQQLTTTTDMRYTRPLPRLSKAYAPPMYAPNSQPPRLSTVPYPEYTQPPSSLSQAYVQQTHDGTRRPTETFRARSSLGPTYQLKSELPSNLHSHRRYSTSSSSSESVTAERRRSSTAQIVSDTLKGAVYNVMYTCDPKNPDIIQTLAIIPNHCLNDHDVCVRRIKQAERPPKHRTSSTHDDADNRRHPSPKRFAQHESEKRRKRPTQKTITLTDRFGVKRRLQLKRRRQGPSFRIVKTRRNFERRRQSEYPRRVHSDDYAHQHVVDPWIDVHPRRVHSDERVPDDGRRRHQDRTGAKARSSSEPDSTDESSDSSSDDRDARKKERKAKKEKKAMKGNKDNKEKSAKKEKRKKWLKKKNNLVSRMQFPTQRKADVQEVMTPNGRSSYVDQAGYVSLDDNTDARMKKSKKKPNNNVWGGVERKSGRRKSKLPVIDDDDEDSASETNELQFWAGQFVKKSLQADKRKLKINIGQDRSAQQRSNNNVGNSYPSFTHPYDTLVTSHDEQSRHRWSYQDEATTDDVRTMGQERYRMIRDGFETGSVFDQHEPTDEPFSSYKTIHLPDRQLLSRVPQTVSQHDRAAYENIICGSLAADNSAASKQVLQEIQDRRQHAATGFLGGATGQWDWRSVISPLPTRTMDHVAIATNTQREYVAGSQNVIVPEQTNIVTPGGKQYEGIDKKTEDRHTHRKHIKKKETPVKKKANEYSPKKDPLVLVGNTEQSKRYQSLSDRPKSPPQHLTESWMREHRTEGDTRTHQETAIHDIPPSGEDNAKKHTHSKHGSGHRQKRDIAEGRPDYVSIFTADGRIYRRHIGENRETTGHVLDESVQHVVFGDDHSKKHKHSKHHGGKHRRDIAEGRSDHANNVAKDRGMEKKHKDTKRNIRVVAGPVQHFTFAPALSMTHSYQTY